MRMFVFILLDFLAIFYQMRRELIFILMYANHRLRDKPGAKNYIKELSEAQISAVALKVGCSSTYLKNYNATPHSHVK